MSTKTQLWYSAVQIIDDVITPRHTAPTPSYTDILVALEAPQGKAETKARASRATSAGTMVSLSTAPKKTLTKSEHPRQAVEVKLTQPKAGTPQSKEHVTPDTITRRRPLGTSKRRGRIPIGGTSANEELGPNA